MDDPQGHTETLQELLGRLNADDPAAVQNARDQILEHTNDRLTLLARKMLRRYPYVARWEETGDVLQDALLKLHRALENVQPSSPREFYGLAAQQIRWRLIDLVRHYFGEHGHGKNYHTDGAGKAPDDSGAVLQGSQATFEPESLEDWERFHQAVDQLPDREKETFQLLWYEGLKQSDAAELLGVTVRTVKNRWRNAKLLLREALNEDAEESENTLAAE